MFAEFRFAARAVARWRGGALAAVLTIGIGIGATTALYALVQLALADFPGVPELDRVARIFASSPSLGVERSPIAVGEVTSKLSRVRSFAFVGAYVQAEAEIGSGADTTPITIGYAMPEFFGAMGVAPASGRIFTRAETDKAQPVALVSDSLWRRRLAGQGLDRASITLNGVERAVVGVMPPEFSYLFVGITADAWIPLAPGERDAPPIVAAYARLRPGVTWAAANAELQAVPGSPGPWTWKAITLEQDVRKRAIGAYTMTLGPALIVLLIACVNVACMLLARGIARDKELSIRCALGASRLRVVRQLLLENLLLAAAGGTIGCGLAAALLHVIAARIAAFQPSFATRILTGTALLPIALASSVIACVLFGMLPAVRLSRRDVAASLNGVPARFRVQIAGYGGRDAVVFAEMACAVGLIVWAGMLFTLFAAMERVSYGVPADRLVAVRVGDAEVRAAADRVAGVPGVVSVTTAAGLPGGDRFSTALLEADGVGTMRVTRVPVGDGFFATMGLTMSRGRPFDAPELHGRAPVVILSETAARRLRPDGDVVGTRIRLGSHPATTLTVVGVCPDVINHGSLSQAGLVPGDVYVPYEESQSNDAIVVARTATDGHAALRAIATVALPDRPARARLAIVMSDNGHLGGQDGNVVISLLGGFAVVALLLAASGVFGVISQSVAQRTTEFGIRMALGARPQRVLGMVLARETKLIGTAIAVGALFTILLTRAMFAELLTVSALAPSVWVEVCVLCGGVAASACALATYRIVRLEPSVVLRRH